MVCDEILESINNVTEAKFGTFNDVNFAIANFYDKQQIMEEYCTDEESSEYFMESAKSNKDKNILQKIWEKIKKFFKMLVAQVMVMIDNIRSRFNGAKKASKIVSCDSIVLRVLRKAKSNVPDNISEWNIPKVNPKYTTDRKNKTTSDDKKDKEDEIESVVTEAATNANYITINIPAGDGSTFYPKTVKVPTNDIITEINDQEKSISFHLSGFGKWSSTKVANSSGDNDSTVKGLKNPWTHSAHISLYLISEPEKFDKLIELTDLAMDALFEDKKIHMARRRFNLKCKPVLNELNKEKKKKKLEKVKVSLNDLTIFQKKINKLNYKMDQFADIGTDVSRFDKETINNFNLLTKALLDVQVSMNMLTSALENNVIINQKFVGCIKSVALLDEFVGVCVDEGMAPKYIAYNTWLVADPCIKGTSNKYKPIWGQTRFIFFPPGGRIVYKIAMSGMGITSNRAEIRTSDMFIKMGRVDLIAPIVKSWNRDAVVAMERIDATDTCSYIECGKYTSTVNNVIATYEKEHKVKLNIEISDQHKDNVKFDPINRCYRSIDYGIANRAYHKNKDK